MGLQDRYRTLTGAAPASPAAAPTSAAPSTARPSTPTSAAPSAAKAPSAPAASSSSPAAASPATGSPTPARRDLTALRQKLAGGNGGCNPPEAVAAVKDDMLDPTTKETADGGAEPLPNHPDFGKKGEVSTDAPADAEAPSEAAPAKRKRRTKAEMEAARAAEAASAASPATAPSTAAGAEPKVYLGHGGQSGEVRTFEEPNPAEFERELAAATAESEGHTILTDDLRRDLEQASVEEFLARLSLQEAIDLVRERLPRGVKTLEVER